MKPVPDEYVETVRIACSQLAEGAKLIMFIAEMLGDDKFTLDTPEGFRVEISQLPPPDKILCNQT